MSYLMFLMVMCLLPLPVLGALALVERVKGSDKSIGYRSGRKSHGNGPAKGVGSIFFHHGEGKSCQELFPESSVRLS